MATLRVDELTVPLRAFRLQLSLEVGSTLALVGPDCPNMVAPVYTCGYTDQLDCVGKDGRVEVPSGPGLGVTYDWGFIRKNAVATKRYE